MRVYVSQIPALAHCARTVSCVALLRACLPHVLHVCCMPACPMCCCCTCAAVALQLPAAALLPSTAACCTAGMPLRSVWQRQPAMLLRAACALLWCGCTAARFAGFNTDHCLARLVCLLAKLVCSELVCLSLKECCWLYAFCSGGKTCWGGTGTVCVQRMLSSVNT